MRLYVAVLSAIIWAALVWTAPVDKSITDQQDENEIQLSKRAKETILYGNHQNSAKHVKRDPKLAEISDKDVDQKGQVLAIPARQIDEKATVKTLNSDSNQDDAIAEEDKNPSQTLNTATSESLSNKDSTDVDIDLPKDDTETDVAQIDPTMESTNQKESEMISTTEDKEPETAESVNVVADPEVEEMVKAGNQENENNLGSPLSESEAQLDDFYKYLMRYESLLEDGPMLQRYPSNYYAYRRLRRALGRMRKMKYDSNKAVKRAKRIKRDLFGDEDEYYYPYESDSVLEEPGYSDEYYPTNDQEEADLLAYLLSLYEDDVSSEPAYQYENTYPDIMEDEPVYVPVKRQMLGALSGMRKRYFYPANNEPSTHWGAFVPEKKRNYYDAYDRVLRLAKALAEDDTGYYPDLYNGYKKK